MSELPPRARLAHVLRSLGQRLPADVGPLLDGERFAEGKASLLRAASAEGATAAAASMTPEEAAWMADLLLARWSLVAEPVLEPAAAIVAPDELWIGNRPVRLPLSLATFGIEDDFQAIWEGAVAEPGGPSGVLLAQPPEGDAPAEAKVRARVRARQKGGPRCALVADAVVRLRRPRILLGGGRRLVVQDHTGRPGEGVTVTIGAERFVTGAGGLLELTTDLGPDAAIAIEGVAVLRSSA